MSVIIIIIIIITNTTISIIITIIIIIMIITEDPAQRWGHRRGGLGGDVGGRIRLGLSRRRHYILPYIRYQIS